jgi:serine/threonine-protein kinase HipA
MIRLRVWANVRPMGWFGHAAGDYFFEYDPQWIEQPGGFALAPQFPLQAKRFLGLTVRTFFENLLPEEEALDDIVSAIHLRGASSFEVLGKLGAELPGVLSLLPEVVRPDNQQEYRPLTYDVLSARLADRGRTPLLVSNVNATMSLAGAQDKLGLRFDTKSRRIRTYP